MSGGLARSVPSLLLPAEAGVLVFPTAMVSEVLVRDDIQPVPATRQWMLGFVMWRGIPVSLVSFDALAGGASVARKLRHIVVLYPFPGLKAHDFTAFAGYAGPQTAYIDSAVKPARAPADLSLQYVAGLLELPQGLGIVPDFEAIKEAFYD